MEMMQRTIHRVIELVDDSTQRILNMSVDEARRRLLSAAESMLEVRGSFALTARDGEHVLMARSLDRPLR